MNDEIASLFDEWNAALQTRDPKQVAALYEGNAILLPTLSNSVSHNHDEIEDYFVGFTAKGPTGTIDESNIRHFGQMAIHSHLHVQL
ncbi:MAG: SgcJ/EcaC family oxidoreductase [Planctomycetota bacterium]